MVCEDDSPEHHHQRSEYIRRLFHAPAAAQSERTGPGVARTIVQFWHDADQLPDDVRECIASWARWNAEGVTHRFFVATSARHFICRAFAPHYARAFARCYHPAMQSDYFRLCYIAVEGGLYVDADDACVGAQIGALFEGDRLKLQPLCYDIESDSMISPDEFLCDDAPSAGRIFYVNNNPLIARAGDPIIHRALERATERLLGTRDGEIPEIQATTGPGNLSRVIFEIGMKTDLGDRVQILRNWESIAISRWPLGYRRDARNWRLSNGKRFVDVGQATP